MRKYLVALVVALGFGLSACSASPGAQEVPSCGDWGETGCPVEVKYEGETLHCLSWDGSHSETGLTCDFVRWHKEHDAEITP